MTGGGTGGGAHRGRSAGRSRSGGPDSDGVADRAGDPAVDPPTDRGSGSVLVLAVVAVAVLLIGGVGMLATAQGARGRAQAAADLGAIAGAQRLVIGADDACAVAAQTVRRNGGEMTACTAGSRNDLGVTVRVGSAVGTATAQARAGPRPEGRADEESTSSDEPDG